MKNLTIKSVAKYSALLLATSLLFACQEKDTSKDASKSTPATTATSAPSATAAQPMTYDNAKQQLLQKLPAGICGKLNNAPADCTAKYTTALTECLNKNEFSQASFPKSIQDQTTWGIKMGQCASTAVISKQ